MRRSPAIERLGQPVASSLATLVRSYKSAVTHGINILRQTSGEAVWQRNYYEHIARREADLNHIREYVTTNPLRWGFDRYNPERRPSEDENFEA